jgi:hypothetical protein
MTTVQEFYSAQLGTKHWYLFQGNYILECDPAGDNLYNLLLTDSEGGMSLYMRNVPGDETVCLAEVTA